jgi:hypothetical protein
MARQLERETTRKIVCSNLSILQSRNEMQNYNAAYQFNLPYDPMAMGIF